MGTGEAGTGEAGIRDLTTDQIEQELLFWEQVRRHAVARQAELAAEADRRQVPLGDGCRNLREWVAAKLDLTREESSQLSRLGTSLGQLPATAKRLEAGECSPGRAVLISRVATAESESDWWERLSGHDLAGAERLVGRHRRVGRFRERRSHRDSFFLMQPALDESWWNIRGGVTGAAGQLISETLRERAEEMGRDAGSMPHRQALALEELCVGEVSAGGPSITVFMDLEVANGTGGEAGAELAFGPRIGPDALDELLCEGAVRIVGLSDGKPVVTSAKSRRIPPAIRDFVMWRDGGCRAGGCRSTHRLQIHHVVPWSHGGTHHPDNLVTLCWYHHHVVVHRRGHRIEKQADGSIRFVLPADARDPPG